MADAVVEGGELRISQIYVNQNSFPGLGEPTIVVDWMIRSHALNERLPLPVDDETAELLHNTTPVSHECLWASSVLRRT